MSTISSTVSPGLVTGPDGMEHGVYYAHYLRDSLGKPAPTMYYDLIAGANSKVVIWDPYFHPADAEVFARLTKEVDVYVLSCKSSQNRTYLQDLIDATRLQIPAAVAGNCNFTFGFIDTDIYGKEVWCTHDRYLIIDDTDYYLIGGSVSQHRAPHQSTGIYQVIEPADKLVIKNAFDKTYAICTSDRTYKVETI